jgi:hypothetical protein
MSLSNYQWSYNGLTFGAGTTSGVGVIEVDGLNDLPDVTGTDTPRPRDVGMLAGLNFPRGRTVTLDLEVVAASGLTLAETVDTVKAAFQPQLNTFPALSWQFPGQDNRLLYARVNKLTAPVDIGFVGGITSVTVQMTAVDPRIYEAVASTATVNLPTPVSGTSFPVTFPLSFGGSSGAGGIIFADNYGTFATRALAYIDGPCINPVLSNDTTGEVLTLGITLASTDTLVVDFDAHTVTLNGTASRYSAVQPGSIFWELPPGTSQIRFTSSDASPTGATLTLVFAPAYL